MEIIRKSLIQGARKAEGIVVIIDVFRAFTSVPLFFYFGSKRVILEPDTGRAIRMKNLNPSYILVGEVDEVPIEEGDMGNSPSEIIKRGKDFFYGKTVIHRTTAGVQGVSEAIKGADEVLLGSFVISKATCEYIKKKAPQKVTIVSMGERGKSQSFEDERCGDYMEYLLRGEGRYDHIETLKEVIYRESAQKFLKRKRPYLPPEDPLICLQMDLFRFALIATRRDDMIEVIRVDG
ncbi:MAG TPA: hypothetical protein ENF54_01105 [Desulfobacteraceae bacterium]|nr:hypothetical protein [Desulfobacteraceae bacterium]